MSVPMSRHPSASITFPARAIKMSKPHRFVKAGLWLGPILSALICCLPLVLWGSSTSTRFPASPNQITVGGHRGWTRKVTATLLRTFSHGKSSVIRRWPMNSSP